MHESIRLGCDWKAAICTVIGCRSLVHNWSMWNALNWSILFCYVRLARLLSRRSIIRI